jgi:hypothetical protein
MKNLSLKLDLKMLARVFAIFILVAGVVFAQNYTDVIDIDGSATDAEGNDANFNETDAVDNDVGGEGIRLNVVDKTVKKGLIANLFSKIFGTT